MLLLALVLVTCLVLILLYRRVQCTERADYLKNLGRVVTIFTTLDVYRREYGHSPTNLRDAVSLAQVVRTPIPQGGQVKVGSSDGGYDKEGRLLDIWGHPFRVSVHRGPKQVPLPPGTLVWDATYADDGRLLNRWNRNSEVSVPANALLIILYCFGRNGVDDDGNPDDQAYARVLAAN